ncbi:exodeoxyribonuclease VII small subunit [Dietzia sp.]|uniref:exodeoxyribonuclease VII small subunit n=1 Tax=Dietzia sp. TaxID=1871616 RepID=UPI002FDB7F6F
MSEQQNRDLANGGASDEETPVAEMGFEAARDELIQVVRMLESGGQDLDTSLTMWERGEELAARCEEHLDGARKRIDKVLAQRDGGEDSE